MRYHVIGLALALALGSVPAGAEGHHGHDEAQGDGGGDHRGHHGDSDSDDDDEDEKGGNAAPEIPRTPEQTDYRNKLLDKEHEIVRDAAKAHGRHIAMEDREQIGMHWRHVMRLLRIRELAQEDKDAALVAKCDELLEKADKRFRDRMAKAGGAAGADAGGKTK
jgi:hypothetical protein